MLQEKTRIQLARHIHEGQWSGWMSHFFAKCHEDTDGNLVCPAEYVEALRRQIALSYDDLTEGEQGSDLQEADEILAIVRAE